MLTPIRDTLLTNYGITEHHFPHPFFRRPEKVSNVPISLRWSPRWPIRLREKDKQILRRPRLTLISRLRARAYKPSSSGIWWIEIATAGVGEDEGFTDWKGRWKWGGEVEDCGKGKEYPQDFVRITCRRGDVEGDIEICMKAWEKFNLRLEEGLKGSRVLARTSSWSCSEA